MPECEFDAQDVAAEPRLLIMPVPSVLGLRHYVCCTKQKRAVLLPSQPGYSEALHQAKAAMATLPTSSSKQQPAALAANVRHVPPISCILVIIAAVVAAQKLSLPAVLQLITLGCACRLLFHLAPLCIWNTGGWRPTQARTWAT